MEVKYLKCTYSQGLFKGEYIVHFNSMHQKWCNVNKSDVTRMGRTSGFVKCFPYAEAGADVCVWINDVGDHRLSPFRVPRADLVDKVKKAA